MRETHFMVLALLRGHASDDIFFGGQLLLHFKQRTAFIERHDGAAALHAELLERMGGFAFWL